MSTVRHVARAVASTGSTTPAYRVDVRAGAHQLVADEPAARGGGDVGPAPFEIFLSALAACTATTLRMYADRHGWALSSIDVGVRYDVDDDDDGRGAIERTITVPADLSADERYRLADIAERTPVTIAVRAGTPITTRFRENDTIRAST
jgi:putative redox protein